MKSLLRNTLAVLGLTIATQAAAEVTFYEHDNFQGRSFTANAPVDNFRNNDFNDIVSSIVVTGERWEMCVDARFSGRCVVFRPGQYPSLMAMELNDRISSTREIGRDVGVDNSRYAPFPVVASNNEAPGQVQFYEREGFQGRSFIAEAAVANFERYGFNDRAASVVVTGERWEACEDARFGGRCVVLRPGRYASLAAMGMGERITSVQPVRRDERVDDRRYAPMQVVANDYSPGQITFYEREGFQGQSFTTEQQIGNFERNGFNDRASSVIVHSGRWEVCEDIRFGGRCVVVRPGRYASLSAVGMNNSISSVRSISRDARVDDHRYAPAPAANRDYRRGQNERLYQANVTSVRAVVGTPEKRCWMEKEQVPQERRGVNVPGAVVGAVLGGILGHQIGGGRGQDIATIGGAVGGGAIGANVGRGGGTTTQDVQRCENVANPASPDYWDVTYNFRGEEHRMQMTSAPGATVTVNAQGEPRV